MAPVELSFVGCISLHVNDFKEQFHDHFISETLLEVHLLINDVGLYSELGFVIT